MDATRLSVAAMMAVYSLINIGCGQTSPSNVNNSGLNGQNCVAQAVAQSFMVKWKDSVPAEYSSKIIHPGALVTKFDKIEKTDLEKTVLAPNVNKVELAEYDFTMDDITVPIKRVTSASVTTTSWGPSDAQAPAAWAAAGGRRGDGVIVGVIDSGVDTTHALLSNALWANPGEIPENSIDDDKNGYVDDINGYNFVYGSADVSDDAGHGSHVSGIIAGQSGPQGFIGMAPNAKIMPLKFLSASGSGSASVAIAAINYAVLKGAKVINASWGGTICSTLLKQEIVMATQAGTLFANAAGNNGGDLNSPQYLEWPAAFQIPGKITIASMNSGQVLSVFSNFGILVDLAAPGENILSTVPPSSGETDNQMAVMSGTSMATPFVAGTAALLYSINPSASATDVANAINNSVSVGHYGVRTQGKLNAAAAVNYFMTH